MELSLNPEIFLLGGIFQDERAIFKVYSTLSAKDFSMQKYGYVFSAMQQLAAENAPIDVLTVFDKMQKNNTAWLDRDDLFSIVESAPSAANIEYYASLIKESSNKRSLYSLVGKIAGMIKDETKPFEEILSFAYDELSLLGKQKKKGPITAAESVEKLKEMIEQNRHLGLQTGLNALDRKITGMRPGEMIVLAAPPSVGKTALAANIANNVLKLGKTVAFFSLEMTDAEIATRFISLTSQVNSKSIINGPDYGESEKLQKGINSYRQTKLFIDDSSEIKVPEIRMTCNEIKCKTGSLDLVVVDYLQLIESGKKENQTIAMGDVSRSLKILAKELEVPVLCLSQLNRGYKDGKISLFNLRDSGNIEQDANQVWFITFPIDFAKDSDKHKHDPKLAKLEIAKNRGGEKGVVDLQFEAEYTLFTDYDHSRMNPAMRNGGADKDGFFPVNIPTEAINGK
ncbi:MAG: AAA family ATPase [Fibromonadaceae bacterium]|jgi:replicative DNA helicase|nr:AAA family ATPase [Fibromonadaceae bacterium]